MNTQTYIHIGLLYFFCKRNEIVYFDSFGVEHECFNKNIEANFFWVQANISIMCGYFCIGFMLAGENLTDFTNMFSPYDSKWPHNFELF